MADNLSVDYGYSSPAPTWSNQYLWPVLAELVKTFHSQEKRVFELGCGNGATANFLFEMGFDVTGVDPSTSGIAVANKAYPGLKLYEGNAYDDLAGRFGRFPLVVSLEVIEHCFYPRKYVQTVFDLLEEGGEESFPPPIMATGKIWPWRLPASGVVAGWWLWRWRLVATANRRWPGR